MFVVVLTGFEVVFGLGFVGDFVGALQNWGTSPFSELVEEIWNERRKSEEGGTILP